MTMTTDCPALEQLFTELTEGKGPALDHAATCARCKGILEEHRQLEKDLYRLADPLPPADLVHRVMAAVAAEPKPVGSEMRAGLFIFVGALVLAFVGFANSGISAGSVGSSVAEFIVSARAFFEAAGRSALSFWATAGVPLTFGSLLLLFISLLGLRKLASSSSEQPA
jgi:hypothetical protein